MCAEEKTSVKSEEASSAAEEQPPQAAAPPPRRGVPPANPFDFSTMMNLLNVSLPRCRLISLIAYSFERNFLNYILGIISS